MVTLEFVKESQKTGTFCSHGTGTFCSHGWYLLFAWTGTFCSHCIKYQLKNDYSLRETRFAALTSLRSGASLIVRKDRIRFAHLAPLSKPLITNLKIQILKPRPLLTSLRSVRTVKSLDQLTGGLGFMPLIAYRLGFASPLGLSNLVHCSKAKTKALTIAHLASLGSHMENLCTL